MMCEGCRVQSDRNEDDEDSKNGLPQQTNISRFFIKS